MSRAIQKVALVAVLASLPSCAVMRASNTPPQPPAPEAWARASTVAAAEVGAGSYAAADRMLADFAQQYTGTPQAVAATIRRALYMADPANQAFTARDASSLLDSLLAQPLDSAPRADARAVRRITSALGRAASLAASSGANTNASSGDNASRADDSRTRDDEIQRLRNDLAKANAELERIKKRVAQPKP